MTDLSRTTNSLAHHMPSSRLYANKFVEGSNIRRMLKGLSRTLMESNHFIWVLATEYFPDQTTNFISEWESAVGIPNECFDGTGTLDVRRARVLAMLRANGAQTEQDFIDLAALLGLTITIDTNVPSILELLPLDVPFIPSAFIQNGEFVFKVQVVGEPVPEWLECFFNKLKSAETVIIYESVP